MRRRWNVLAMAAIFTLAGLAHRGAMAASPQDSSSPAVTASAAAPVQPAQSVPELKKTP